MYNYKKGVNMNKQSITKNLSQCVPTLWALRKILSFSETTKSSRENLEI